MSSGYEFTTREELDTAVEMWCNRHRQEIAIATYGDINTWDVSSGIAFYSMFSGADAFNR